MGIHVGDEKTQTRINSSGEPTNAAARTRRAGGRGKTAAKEQAELPSHLTQAIKSAQEAKDWLAAHAGVTVDLGNSGNQSTKWSGPTHQYGDDALGYSHGVWVSKKSEVIQAAKAIQAFMRTHPGEYQASHAAALETAIARTRQIQQEATRTGDAPRAAAAAALLQHFTEAQSAAMPDRVDWEYGGHRYSENGTVESKAQQLARFTAERDAQRLYREVLPQQELTPGATDAADKRLAAYGNELVKLATQVRDRQQGIDSLMAALRRPAPQATAQEQRARVWLLGQLKNNPDRILTPSKAPARGETPAQEWRRLERDHIASEMWFEALRNPDYSDGYQRDIPHDLLTPTEGRMYSKAWDEADRAYRHARERQQLAEANAANAQAAREANATPMARAVRAGQSFIARDREGKLYTFEVHSYHPDQQPEQGGRLTYTLHTESALTNPRGWDAQHRSSSDMTLGQFAQMQQRNDFTFVQAFKSRAAAANYVKSQSNHLESLMTQAQNDHRYALSKLEDARRAEAKAAAEFENFKPWYTNQGMTPPKESFGMQRARAERVSAERRVAKAEGTIRNLTRMRRQAAQQQKAQA